MKREMADQTVEGRKKKKKKKKIEKEYEGNSN